MDDLMFQSRRSALVTCQGAVSSDQPLASQAGLDILRDGGNAADAAVAMAAVLNVTQPNSTGLGGDAFCLFYDAKTKKVKGLNGSGRSSSNFTLSKVLSDGFGPNNMYPNNHGHAVTVPGAPAAWLDTVQQYGSGKLSISRILQPAIELAETGFPITEICAYWWKQGEHLLTSKSNVHGHTMLINGRAPKYGEIFRNPDLANTLKELAIKGKSGFYSGKIANAICDVVQKHGGTMTTDDLTSHVTTFDDPISVEYKGVRLWEIPPNGQGIVALMASNIMGCFDVKAMGHNSPQYIHTLAEAFQMSFCDGLAYIADPSKAKVPIEQMLSKERAKARAANIKSDRTSSDIRADVIDFPAGRDTTYFSTVDKDGNACSFINSNFHGFGTGLVPEGCGITLQNRGCGFSLVEGHANVAAPNKRPYHSIIPAMLTSDTTGDLLASYGVMGGFMQPQGHVQVMLNMVEFGMDPQTALDQPRICIGSGYGLQSGLMVEDGIPDDVIQQLSIMGHDVTKATGHKRSVFGRGHVITNGAWWSKDGHCFNDKTERVWWSGSDPRCDGLAAGY